MLWREDHEHDSPQGIGSGSEDWYGLAGLFDSEIHTGSFAPAYPVALHGLDALWPRQGVYVLEQLFSVGGYPKEPLRHVLLGDVARAPPALAVMHLLIRQHRVAGRTPVSQRRLAIGETFLIELGEYPLVPSVVIRVMAVDHAVPVIAEPECLLLAHHGPDVVVGPVLRADLVLDGGVLGGKSEGVIAHGIQDRFAFHALIAREGIADGIVAAVAHVQA